MTGIMDHLTHLKRRLGVVVASGTVLEPRQDNRPGSAGSYFTIETRFVRLGHYWTDLIDIRIGSAMIWSLPVASAGRDHGASRT